MSGQSQVSATDRDQDAGSRPLRADARRNYDRLVEAARKVFADQGGGASMEAIAKQAGVGVGTLYRHFPKRIDLVEAVYRDDVDVLVGAAESGADRAGAVGRPRGVAAGLRRLRPGQAHVPQRAARGVREEPRPEVGVARPGLGGVRSRCSAGPRTPGLARSDIDGGDLMQLVSPMCMNTTLTAEQGERLLAMVLDGLRTPRS